MAWRTAKVDIDGKTYTVREPTCGSFDRLVAATGEDRAEASVDFVIESIKPAHPDITASVLFEGLPLRERWPTVMNLVKTIMALSGAEEPAPGEPASA